MCTSDYWINNSGNRLTWNNIIVFFSSLAFEYDWLKDYISFVDEKRAKIPRIPPNREIYTSNKFDRLWKMSIPWVYWFTYIVCLLPFVRCETFFQQQEVHQHAQCTHMFPVWIYDTVQFSINSTKIYLDKVFLGVAFIERTWMNDIVIILAHVFVISFHFSLALETKLCIANSPEHNTAQYMLFISFGRMLVTK